MSEISSRPLLSMSPPQPIGPLRQRPVLTRALTLLTLQSLLIILGSINRLTDLTSGFVAANEFLRWVDLLNMVPLPLLSVLLSYLLLREIGGWGGRHERLFGGAGLLLISGIYLLGASYGDHELSNYLHSRFCADGPSSDLCRIIIFNDDEFSHWLFFGGFILVNVALILAQIARPFQGGWTRRENVLLLANSLFVAAGIFANLAFETIGLDLVVIIVLAIVASLAMRRYGRQPMLVFYSSAYVIGLVATVIYRFGGL